MSTEKLFKKRFDLYSLHTGRGTPLSKQQILLTAWVSVDVARVREITHKKPTPFSPKSSRQ